MTDVFSWLRGLAPPSAERGGNWQIYELWPLALDVIEAHWKVGSCVFCGEFLDEEEHKSQDCPIAAFLAAAERERGET